MSSPEIIADGLRFPEGPVVMADGSVIVVEIGGGAVTRCWNGRKEVIATPGDGPNGAAIGPDGALYICNCGSGITPAEHSRTDRVGRIERIDLATGKVERLFDSCDGQPLSAPNDLTFDRDGRMWFTDMGKFMPTGREFGGLYAASIDGGSITRIAGQALSYNGVGISPGGETVYVADTYQARVYAFAARAQAQEPRVLGTVTGSVGLDSLAVTEAGNLCIGAIGQYGAEGGIVTVAPDGSVIGFEATGDKFTTNIAFGGAAMRDAYITLSIKGALVRMAWREPGMRLHFNG